MACDGAEDVVTATKSIKNSSAYINSSGDFPTSGGILCAKASMLLQVSSNYLCLGWYASL